MKISGTVVMVALMLASSVGCKKKVDMVIPDAGVTTAATIKPTAPATVAADDTAPPLATLAPTKPPPMPVVTIKPAGSNAASTPSGVNPPECDAAKVMLANGRQAEYDTLKKACLSKGGKL